MSNTTAGKPQLGLSKSVMSMKFMKKKEEVEAKEKEERMMIQKLQSGDWVASPSAATMKDGSKSTEVTQNLNCVRESQDLYSCLPGRRSFNGCNKAMERHYQQIIDAKYFETYGKNTANETEAPKEEIDYEKLVSLPRGPNQGKRPAISLQQEEKAKKKFKKDHEPGAINAGM